MSSRVEILKRGGFFLALLLVMLPGPQPLRDRIPMQPSNRPPSMQALAKQQVDVAQKKKIAEPAFIWIARDIYGAGGSRYTRHRRIRGGLHRLTSFLADSLPHPPKRYRP